TPRANSIPSRRPAASRSNARGFFLPLLTIGPFGRGTKIRTVRYSSGRSRHQVKPQIYLPEVVVAGEDVGQAEVLHDDHGREVDEGDGGLVVVLLPHGPRPAELVGGEVHQLVGPGVGRSQNGIDEGLGVGGTNRVVQIADRFTQNEIRRG